MNSGRLKAILQQVKDGLMEPEEALEGLKNFPYEDLGFAKIDHHRSLRNGFPEVIYCQGKSPNQVRQIFARLAHSNNNILATRAEETIYSEVIKETPQAVYHALARCITLTKATTTPPEAVALVISAGTADLPVAEEAAITVETMGFKVEKLFDVGVAGLHRLLHNHKKMQQASVIIVVAGMEGALASVVGGLVDKPIIAVPTSVGYGASFGGLAALLAMLNSCAAGVAVVNIDNGFGAGALAASILRLKEGSQ